MKSRILNVMLLSVLCLLVVTFSNAQVTSNEVMTAKGDGQDFSKQKVVEAETEMEERIQRGDLLEPIGASAFDTYKNYIENHPSDDYLEGKLKRSLVSALADASDKALIDYFDQGGTFIFQFFSAQAGMNKNLPIDQYCFVAADLLGKDHRLSASLKSKGYFIEALKLRYVDKKKAEDVIEKLEKSITLDPIASYTYNELGQVYFDEENYKQACENYNQAINLNGYWDLPKENLKLAEQVLSLIESKSKSKKG